MTKTTQAEIGSFALKPEPVEWRDIQCTKCGKIDKPSVFDKSSIAKATPTGRCIECKRANDRDYYKRNKSKRAEYDRRIKANPKRREQLRLSSERRRFGFNVAEWVKDKVCNLCGMSNEEHRRRFGERLQVHHNDGEGRTAMEHGRKPNNDANNLVIICRPCHCKIENKEHRNYTGRGCKVWKSRRAGVAERSRTEETDSEPFILIRKGKA